MARIHTILQGFVDINLETNENINTTVSTETFNVESEKIVIISKGLST